MADRRGAVPRGSTGELHTYCENPDCAAREVRVHVKAYDGAVSAPYRCPLCGSELNIHDTLMGERWQRASEAEALAVATAALARAYHRERGGGPFRLMSTSVRALTGEGLVILLARVRALLAGEPVADEVRALMTELRLGGEEEVPESVGG